MGQFRSGKCEDGGKNDYKCNWCANRSCKSGQFRKGTCSSTTKGYTCGDFGKIANCNYLWCSALGKEQCNGCKPGYYIKHGSTDTCNECSNKACPKGQFRGGSCSGATNGYTCSADKSVFVRWGNRGCPSGTQKLYEGWVGGGHHGHNGSGTNYMCMLPSPQWISGMSNGNQNGALIYGTEYENTGAVDKHHDKDAGCVVCFGANKATPYTQWGRISCTHGHRREYWGVVMASHYSQKKSRYICVDWDRAYHARSSNANNNGALLYTTEVEQGSSDEAQYGHDREISCAVCSPGTGNRVYTQWGKLCCSGGSTKLYQGWVGSHHYGHNGSGSQYLCMNPAPQWPPGMRTNNQNGALIYGTEYENTGAIDKHHDKDAGCAVCLRKGTAQVFTNWGRTSCITGTRLYWGVVMANHYTQQRSTFICVDFDRSIHARSSNANNNGALLYTTEMEGGSADETLYPHDREVAYCVCQIASGAVYSRWGSNSCTGGAKKIDGSFMASGHYGHNGSGVNWICMSKSPQFAPGTHGGNQNGALLYGTEYQSTGAVDKNHDRDAACAVCNHPTSPQVYIQWGRLSCTNGFLRQYYGVVMATHYTQKKSTFVCVDWERTWHSRNHNGDQNGALLYTTEVEQGSADEAQYGQSREISCCACAI